MLSLKQNRYILREKAVRHKTGLSTAWIYDLMRRGLFPKNFKLVPNGRASGWYSDEIDNWMESRRNLNVEGK